MAVKLPKTIGTTADKIYEIKQDIAGIKKQATTLEKDRIELEDHFRALCVKNKVKSAKGKVGCCELKPQDIPTIEDFEIFCKFLKKRKGIDGFSFFQRRLSTDAISSYHEQHDKLPAGLKYLKRTKLSVTKA